MEKKVKNQKGYLLLDVMIATAIFGFAVVALLSGFGYNLLDSRILKDDAKMMELAEYKINELILDPPPFRETLTEARPEQKKFDDDPEYTFSTKMKKFSVPDITKIQGRDEEGDSEAEAQVKAFEKKIFQQIKTNIEKSLWQIEVVIEHTESESSITVTRWLLDPKAKISFTGF